MFTCPRIPNFRTTLILILLWNILFQYYIWPNVGYLVDYSRGHISQSREFLYFLTNSQWRYFDPDSHWERGLGHLTGLERGDRLAWGRWRTWQKRCWKGSHPQRKGMKLDERDWVNVTGVLSGEWVRYVGDLVATEKNGGQLNLWDTEDWMMNVKGNEGRVILKIDEEASLEMEVEEEPALVVEDQNELGVTSRRGVGRDTALVRQVAATLTVQEKGNSGDDWEIPVFGVHWPRIGALLMTTTSKKFAGIFGLPYLSLENDYFITSQRLLSAVVEQSLWKSVWFDARNPWIASSRADADAWWPVPRCEYVVYVQLDRREDATIDGQLNVQDISEMEREMGCPYGSTILRAPELQMSTVIFSPNCGFILESKGSPSFSSLERQHLVCNEQEKP